MELEEGQHFEREESLAAQLRNGALGIVPTDTVYGLVASIHRDESVRTVFRVKDRPREKTVPVLVGSGQVEQLARIRPVERDAVRQFWPGGLTLVLEACSPEDWAVGLVREGTMAVRMPDHPALLNLLDRTGPLVGTSANRSGEPAPARPEALDPTLVDRVDFTVRGPELPGTSSTVGGWDASRETWVIHRTGPVTVEELPGAESDDEGDGGSRTSPDE